MQDLNICLLQTDILWEQRDENLQLYSAKLGQMKRPCDLIVLPEMFATGFTMNRDCAEDESGPTLQWMKEQAKKHQCVITGSIITLHEGDLYNRLYWVLPQGNYQYYDKRHLFRFGGEHEYYAPGNRKIIVQIKDWNICPLICYDLRFPVWARNTYTNTEFEYDCLLYIANWPERRAHHWKSLLVARAIENLSYCIGVNRIGADGKGLTHCGNSMVVDPQGNVTLPLADSEQGLIELVLERKQLLDWRNRFNVAQDWDHFNIKD